MNQALRAKPRRRQFPSKMIVQQVPEGQMLGRVGAWSYIQKNALIFPASSFRTKKKPFHKIYVWLQQNSIKKLIL